MQPPVEDKSSSTDEGEEASTEEDEEEALQGEESESDESGETDDDVLSKFDLDSMSPEELRALGAKLGSRALSRFSQMTARAKTAEEKLQEAQARKAETVKPAAKPIADNPLSEYDTLDKLAEVASNADDMIEWAENLLLEAEDNMSDDVITTIGDKEFTKLDVIRAKQQAVRTRTKLIPDQERRIKEAEQAKQLGAAFDQKAVEQLPWLSEDDHELNQLYHQMMGDERVKDALKAIHPQFAAQLPYIVAHAANSIYGMTEDKKGTKVKAGDLVDGPKPPASVSGSQANRPGVRTSSKLEDAIAAAEAQYAKTGKFDDLVTLRTLTKQR